MNAVEAARRYLERGFAPIPVPARTKAPIRSDWQHLRVSAEQTEELFRGANVGLLLGTPSNGLVDVDLDAPEAVAMAEAFLPATPMIHGRAGKPRSHWWYRVDSEMRTRRFQDIDGACLAELRGTGGQTIVPPSIHPSGELVEWAESGEPLALFAEDLAHAAARLASAALLVRHYPKPGGRQDFALALSGVLLRRGWSEGETRDLVLTVARSAADEEADKRGDTVVRTAESLGRGTRVTGLPKLTELLGSEVARKLIDWLDLGATSSDAHRAASRTDRNQLEQLLGLVADLELFHSSEDEAFVMLPMPTGPETIPVDGLAFRRWICCTAQSTLHFFPRDQALKELIHYLVGEAKHQRPEHDVYLRVAGDSERILIDLADHDRKVIEVTADGWRPIQNCSTRFFRPSGVKALPVPKTLEGLDYFREFFVYGTEDELRLLLAWLIYAWNPSGPYPVLILQGEAGSGKSTLARMLRRMVDPVSLALRAFPHEERNLVIAARTNHVLCFDNLSGLSDRASDMLCRVATGAGFATRQLYSNFDEVRFEMRRPVILNGIDDLASRPDLIDRAIVLTLPAIPPDARRDEVTLWRNFETASPYMLGALLAILVDAIRSLPSVSLKETPRMADFARWSTAAEQALGWSPGGFMIALRENQAAALEVGVESSAVATAVRDTLAHPAGWKGTPSDLLDRLNRVAAEHYRTSRTWPRDPSQLGNQLRRVAPALRAQGVAVIFSRASDRRRTRLIELAWSCSPTTVRTEAEESAVHAVRRPAGTPPGQGCPRPPPQGITPAEMPSRRTEEPSDGSDTSDGKILNGSQFAWPAKGLWRWLTGRAH